MHDVYHGVELGELDIRSVAKMIKKSEPLPSRLEVCDSNGGYIGHNVGAVVGIELVEHVLIRRVFESHQDVAGTNATWRTARPECLRVQGPVLRGGLKRHERRSRLWLAL